MYLRLYRKQRGVPRPCHIARHISARENTPRLPHRPVPAPCDLISRGGRCPGGSCPLGLVRVEDSLKNRLAETGKAVRHRPVPDPCWSRDLIRRGRYVRFGELKHLTNGLS